MLSIGTKRAIICMCKFVLISTCTGLNNVPTILNVGPYRFFFVSLDYGEPPHVHVQRERHIAKFWIDPVVLEKAGGFNSAELNRIGKLVQENRQYLLERWYEFFSS